MAAQNPILMFFNHAKARKANAEYLATATKLNITKRLDAVLIAIKGKIIAAYLKLDLDYAKK